MSICVKANLNGEPFVFDADDFAVTTEGQLLLLKDEEKVAVFATGCWLSAEIRADQK